MGASPSSSVWRLRNALLWMLLLLPRPLVAADERSPRWWRAEAGEIRQLERLIENRQAELDSLLEAIDVRSELLVEKAIQSRIERLQSGLAEDRERMRELVEALPAPEAPKPPRRALRRKPVAYDMIRLGADVEVREDEVVRGDAIIVGGDLWVDGEIQGDAIVIGGNLEVGRRAVIDGQAMSIGGRVETSPGAEVEGQTVSLTLFPIPGFPGFDHAWPHWAALVLDVVKLGFLMLAAGSFLIVVPERMSRAKEYLDESFLKCFALGLLAMTGGAFAVGVGMVLLVITVIGIPVALLVGFSCGALLIASLLVGVLVLGEKLRDALRVRSRAPLTSAFLGLSILLLPEFLSDVMRIALPVSASAFAFGLLSATFLLGTMAAGLGALVLSRLGAGASGEAAQAAQ
ncbi:MAG: hypothetical protein ACE5G2_00945 [Candidatus Krumholzibacteriia bacterium]